MGPDKRLDIYADPGRDLQLQAVTETLAPRPPRSLWLHFCERADKPAPRLVLEQDAPAMGRYEALRLRGALAFASAVPFSQISLYRQ